MEAVIGLLLMLLRVTHGVETSCDGRQNGTQCYGALGGTVVLQLMDSTSDIFRYQWSDKTGAILGGGQNRPLHNWIAKRSVFTPSNGTFRINNLITTDDGEYTLRIFDSSGKQSEKRILQLTIQAPVSSVLLDTECLSQGELRVSCSSEGGDSPQYSWTLNGHTLTDAQLFSGNNETNIITLKQDVSGQLVCSVENHVSRVSKEVNRSTCGFIFINCTLPNGTPISQWVFEATNSLCVEPTTTTTSPTTTEGKETHVSITPIDHPWYIRYLYPICGLRTAVVILIFIGITIYFAWKKKKLEMAEGSAVLPEVEHQENSVVKVEMI
uniref:T-cell surface antigen CD2-like n=1 Tax=Scatophagus argus TaxID=75038 RepID=UPI001ED84F75|nr:T-cell surface antigen CD2-like [Scatophagus argus]